MKLKTVLVVMSVGVLAVAALAVFAQSPIQRERESAGVDRAVRARLLERTEGFSENTLRELQATIVRLEYKAAADNAVSELPADDIWALRDAFHRRIDSVEDVSVLRSMFRAAVESQHRNEDLDRALERSNARLEAMRRFRSDLERGVDLQGPQH